MSNYFVIKASCFSKFFNLISFNYSSYIGHGNSVKNTVWLFRIGTSTMYDIIEEVSNVLVEVLQPLYLKTPTKAEWSHISSDIYKEFSFPNCLGRLHHLMIWLYLYLW